MSKISKIKVSGTLQDCEVQVGSNPLKALFEKQRAIAHEMNRLDIEDDEFDALGDNLHDIEWKIARWTPTCFEEATIQQEFLIGRHFMLEDVDDSDPAKDLVALRSVLAFLKSAASNASPGETADELPATAERVAKLSFEAIEALGRIDKILQRL